MSAGCIQLGTACLAPGNHGGPRGPKRAAAGLLIALYVALGVAFALFSGGCAMRCAPVPPVSLVKAQTSVATAKASAKDARAAVQSAREELAKSPPAPEKQAALQYLEKADTQLRATGEALSGAEAATLAAMEQAAQMQARMDTLSAKHEAACDARERWRRRAFSLGAALGGALLWIFRKPLLMLLGV